MRLGTDDDAVVWIDGREIFRYEGVRGLERDEDIVPLELSEGASRILIKVCNREGMWAFTMRFTDTEGLPLGGLSFDPTSD